MKRSTLWWTGILASSVCWLSTTVVKANPQALLSRDYIVRMKPGYDFMTTMSQRYGNSVELRDFTYLGLGRIRFPNRPHGVVPMSNAIETLEGVEYAVANRSFTTQSAVQPNDPFLSIQHGLQSIQAAGAWNVTQGSPYVKVGILDTGIDPHHPDLLENLWINRGEIGLDQQGRDRRTNGIDDEGNGYIDDWQGWNFAEDSNDVMDFNGHGTQVAGIIGASTNNGQGVTGVAWHVRLVPLRVFSLWQGASLSAIVEALNYAAAMGIDVTNISWGSMDPVSTSEIKMWQDIMSHLEKAGQLFVVAAGSQGQNIDFEPVFPANLHANNVIVVGASAMNGHIADFSNHGVHSVDLVAPGQSIWTTQVTGDFTHPYILFDGSSAAAPFVTGTIALMRSQDVRLSAQTVKRYLLEATDKFPELSGMVGSGGRLNASKALNRVLLNQNRISGE